jgi:hypothetical protein
LISSAGIKVAQGFDVFLGNDQLFTDLYVIKIANYVVLEGERMMRLLGEAGFASTGDA